METASCWMEGLAGAGQFYNRRAFTERDYDNARSSCFFWRAKRNLEHHFI